LRCYKTCIPIHNFTL